MTDQKVLLADGTVAKVGLKVTNVPGEVRCAYGGCYVDGDVGVIHAIPKQNCIHVLFSRHGTSTWASAPNELISLKGMKSYLSALPKWAKPDSAVRAITDEGAEIIGRVINAVSKDLVLITCGNNLHRCKISSMKPYTAYEAKPLDKAKSHVSGRVCVLCRGKKESYLGELGWLCEKCFNDLTTCYTCHAPIRKGRGFYTPNGTWLCKLCFLESLPPKQQIAKKFHLDHEMWLAQAAADFYLSYLLKVETGNDALFSPIVDKLAHEFSRYMFLAIGGEIRHFEIGNLQSLSNDEFSSLLSTLVEQPRESIWFLLERFHSKSWADRDSMWQRWEEQSEISNMLELTRLAQKMFLVPRVWSHQVGGKNWADISSVLIQYLNDDINKTIFVDTAFGLKHNCTLQFSKAWELAGLEKALEDNACSNYEALFEIASEGVKESVRCLMRKTPKPRARKTRRTKVAV
jgi:hypothetical protein